MNRQLMAGDAFELRAEFIQHSGHRAAGQYLEFGGLNFANRRQNQRQPEQQHFHEPLMRSNPRPSRRRRTAARVSSVPETASPVRTRTAAPARPTASGAAGPSATSASAHGRDPR